MGTPTTVMAKSELEITELRLGLPGGRGEGVATEEKTVVNEKKRGFSAVEEAERGGGGNKGSKKNTGAAAAVGWPPVCSYRRRSIGSEKECMAEAANNNSKRLVKISKDGVPFLRKIDVSDFKDYFDLVAAIEKLFACSGLEEAVKNMYTDKVEYVPIYEDKDGDWLLVGDLPWKMFVETCKRLRIMKRSDAKGFGVQSKKLFQG